MIAKETWLIRCGDAGLTSNDADTSVPGLDDIGTTPGDGFIQQQTMLDKLDSSGLGGGGQCPKLPQINIPFFGFESDGNAVWWCDFWSQLGDVLVFAAAVAAAIILGYK
jgi:hypothetical protein